MTGPEMKKLVVGDRVLWVGGGDKVAGTVVAILTHGVTIDYDDGINGQPLDPEAADCIERFAL